jgi:hypothetical protein
MGRGYCANPAQVFTSKFFRNVYASESTTLLQVNFSEAFA